MLKIAFVFPGQSSQEVGMGRDLIKKYREADELFNEANDSLIEEGIDLKTLCLEGPEEELNKTANSQPAILTLSYILFTLLRNNNVRPDIIAGHSLGEYSALVSASAIRFKDAVRLVRKRGQYMQDATPTGFGSMAAIISLNQEKMKTTIKTVCREEAIEVANYNSPYQIVVSGKNEAIEKLLKFGEKDEEINIIPLRVSAPFHSTYMSRAKGQLADYLQNIIIQNPRIPLISNVTADYVRTEGEIKQALIEQMIRPVRWIDIIHRIEAEGIDCYIEVGPGNVLKKLIKQIIPKAKVYNADNSENLAKIITAINKG